MRALKPLVAVGAALVAGTLLAPAATTGQAHPAAPVAAPRMQLVSSSPVLLGLQEHTLDGVAATESRLGVRAGIVGSFWRWSTTSDFPASFVSKIRARGEVPMLAWIEADKSGSINDPAYSLRAINAGHFDTYIRRWAKEVDSFGHPVLIRLFPEMNLPHHSYSIGVNGNTAAQFVTAWRHVVRIFRNNGATNAKWVWNPNRYFSGGRALSPMWPGYKYVNWVGIDAYNFGLASHGGWISFGTLISGTIKRIRGFAPHKPLMLPEVGCSETGGDKAHWLDNMFARADDFGIRALVWYDYKVSNADWRFESSSSALSAAKRGVRVPTWTNSTELSLSRLESYVSTGSL